MRETRPGEEARERREGEREAEREREREERDREGGREIERLSLLRGIIVLRGDKCDKNASKS
jgi:hypothetical protein